MTKALALPRSTLLATAVVAPRVSSAETKGSINLRIESNTRQLIDEAAAILGNPAGCAKSPFYRALGSAKTVDGVSQVMVTKGCAATASGAYPGATSSRGEQSLILHFRDAQNTYSLQFAVRRSFLNGQPPIADKAAAGTLAQFGRVRLCSTSSTDAECRSAQLLERQRSLGR